MNIYEFKFSNGGKDWVFAPDLKTAKEFLSSHTGCDDLVHGCKVTCIPESKWDSFLVLDPDSNETIETFAQYAARETKTDIIATTAY
jgi:hypothetical protein